MYTVSTQFHESTHVCTLSKQALLLIQECSLSTCTSTQVALSLHNVTLYMPIILYADFVGSTSAHAMSCVLSVEPLSKGHFGSVGGGLLSFVWRLSCGRLHCTVYTQDGDCGISTLALTHTRTLSLTHTYSLFLTRTHTLTDHSSVV